MMSQKMQKRIQGVKEVPKEESCFYMWSLLHHEDK